MVSRIEKPRRRCTVFLLGLLFLLVFFILLGIGAESPAVLQEFEDANGANVVYFRKHGVNAYHPEFELTPEHQVFWLDLQLSTGNGLLKEMADADETTVDIDLDLTVVVKGLNDGDEELTQIESFTKNVTQTCVVTEEWCNPVYIWRRDFIDYEKYFFVLRLPDPDEYLTFDTRESRTSPLFDMRAKVTAINPRFTRFEIGWKYTWFVATLLLMFAPCNMGFYWKLRKRRYDQAEPRTYHQRWSLTLLWMLLWFNDPFAAAAVYTGWAKFFAALFIASASVFVALILLFWLCFLSDLRFMQHRWEEVILTLAIGLTVFSGYVYYRFWDTVSPEYTGLTDEKLRAEELAGLLGAMLAVYMLWVLILVLRSCGTLRRSSPSYILLFFVTVLTCLVAVIGVFVASYYPYSTSGTAFVGIHGLMNLYVWTLAASFAPIETSREIFPKDDPAGEMPTVVVGGTEHDNSDIAAWTEHADHDFKAVEL